MASDNEYEFITSPQKLPAPGGIPVIGGGSAKKKLFLFAGMAAAVLIVIIIVVFALFSKREPDNKADLLAAATQQSELIRISEVGLKQLKNTDARSLAITVKLGLRSDQSALTAALKSQKVKMPKPSKNPGLDERLASATQNNRFDQEFMVIIQEQLDTYQKKLKTAYNTTQSKKLQETLKRQSEHASTLIGVNPEI